jgi:hypothetical protein
LAPSHQLLDLANSIVESGAIVWIAPSRCSKRDDEIHANIKPSSSTVQVENSTLKLAQVPVSTTADLGYQGRQGNVDNTCAGNSDSLRPVNDVPALNAPFKALVADPRVTMFLLLVASSVSKNTAAPAQSTPKATGDCGRSTSQVDPSDHLIKHSHIRVTIVYEHFFPKQQSLWGKYLAKRFRKLAMQTKLSRTKGSGSVEPVGQGSMSFLCKLEG